MLPVVRALGSIPGTRQEILLTGQHTGLEAELGLPGIRVAAAPPLPRDFSLPFLQRHFRRFLAGRMLASRPDVVLVHGDTTSALAGALAADDCAIPIGHVEAGLRSHDLRQPFPEEGHRVAIDCLSHLLFAPTLSAAFNLRNDLMVGGQIFVTGNTGIDAVFAARDAIAPSMIAPRRKTILVTCHRGENQGAATARICAALKRIVEEMPVDIVLPLHSNPAVRAPIVRMLNGVPHVRLIEPATHNEMVALMLEAWLILTDSGGLQEEGAALGRPVFVLRDVTERNEGIHTANIRLVGTGTQPIVDAVAALLGDSDLYRRMAVPSHAFGDGRAAPRIAAELTSWLWRTRGPAPKTCPLHAPALFAKDKGDEAGMASRQLETV